MPLRRSAASRALVSSAPLDLKELVLRALHVCPKICFYCSNRYSWRYAPLEDFVKLERPKGEAQSIKSTGQNIHRLIDILFQKIDAGDSDIVIAAIRKEIEDETRKLESGTGEVNDDGVTPGIAVAAIKADFGT